MMQPVSNQNRKIVLASGSPRRLRLMRRLGFEPVIEISSIPEQRATGESPSDYTARLAVEKARNVAERLAGSDAPAWVLAADTIVAHEGDVLEKPVDREDAVSMLEQLSGTRHEVITSFAWLQRHEDVLVSRDVNAMVDFRELDGATIERYVDTGEPFDKAGGYGIQDLASAFVRSLEGSYFAIVGLPVCEVIETLEEQGGLVDFPFETNED
ncbi:MAG: Maf family protein [Myxococcota bacterium]